MGLIGYFPSYQTIFLTVALHRSLLWLGSVQPTSCPVNQQGQVAEANTVAANSISWYVDNAHNETVLYVNTGTTANHVDMEIHLTGTNINLAGSDILHHA